jgi:Domain of unknown function (DUF1818)
MARQLKQGQGWRLGWHPEAGTYPALVGGDTWAIELTEPEFQAFCRLFLELTQSMASIATELMPEETIACETQNELIWMEVRGYADSYDLSFILLTGRRGEGQWPATALPALLQAVQMLQVF